MAISETGYKRRTYDEILTEKIQMAKNLFGEDINTEENTPLGKFIRINAYDEALLSEEIELVYYSIFPNTAMGVSLDRLCVFAGISRNPATAARFKVTVKGTDGTTVPLGFLVGTESGITYYNNNDVVVSGDTAILEVDCTENGEIGNVAPQDITQIINPAANVEEIVSVELVYKGEETESDYALRKRFETARNGLGACNEPSIIAAVMRIPTVESVGVIANESDETVSGRPPHSFECYVQGGENYHQQIAEAIFEKKPIGIKTTGSVGQEITDAAGNPYTVYFSHTAIIDVYVNIQVNVSTQFEGDSGIEEIKNNITDYVESLGVGGSVILSALYGEIHKVAGVEEVTTLKLSTDGNTWTTSNIMANNYENCICKQVTIEVI